MVLSGECPKVTIVAMHGRGRNARWMRLRASSRGARKIGNTSDPFGTISRLSLIANLPTDSCWYSCNRRSRFCFSLLGLGASSYSESPVFHSAGARSTSGQPRHGFVFITAVFFMYEYGVRAFNIMIVVVLGSRCAGLADGFVSSLLLSSLICKTRKTLGSAGCVPRHRLGDLKTSWRIAAVPSQQVLQSLIVSAIGL